MSEVVTLWVALGCSLGLTVTATLFWWHTLKALRNAEVVNKKLTGDVEHLRTALTREATKQVLEKDTKKPTKKAKKSTTKAKKSTKAKTKKKKASPKKKR